MAEPANGFELLEQLREKNGKKIQNYKSLSSFLDFKAREKGVPVHCQFELTPLCNFNCPMCYVHLNPDQLNGRSVFSVEEWKDLMHQAWEAGMIHATLTGGECLTYPGFDELFLYLHSLGCDISVLTNGYLLNDERIRFFKEHPPAFIQITLYGWNDDVYERITGKRAFQTVMENARKAIEADLPISINVTPSIYLGEDVLETIRIGMKMSKSFTVNSALFTPREETGRSDHQDTSETDLYIRIYRLINELGGRETKEADEDKLLPAGGPFHECNECGLRCGGGRSSYVLDWKGMMMACNRMHMINADARRIGIKEAWAKVNHEASNWPRVPECIECPYDRVCNNCAGNMLRFAAPGKQPTELCEQAKAYVRNGVRYIPECD